MSVAKVPTTQDKMAHARRLLVDGLFQNKVAKKSGLSASAISRLFKEILREHGVTSAVAEQIHKLIADRVTYQEISTQFDLPIGLVSLMAHRRPKHPDTLVVHIRGKAQRCPGCGGAVEMPCIVCTVRESRKRNPEVCNIELLSKQDIKELKEQLDIRYTLAPEHLARALEVRERAGRKPR